MMQRFAAMALVVAGLLVATAADAGPKGDKEHDKANGKGNSHFEGAKCPPGLAKKNPPCVPPGLAHRDDDHGNDDHGGDDHQDGRYFQTYEVGRDLPDGHVILFDPALYPVWQQALYVRSGDYLYLIDRLTGAILQNLGRSRIGPGAGRMSILRIVRPALPKRTRLACRPVKPESPGPSDPWKVADHLPAGYTVILTPPRQQAPDTSVYVRLGDSIYRVDRQTGEVMQLIGVISTLLR